MIFNSDEDEDELSLKDDEEVKSETDKIIFEKSELNPQKKKKTGAELKNLTLNKLLTRLLVLLSQLKAGNNSYKLKNEIKQILYLLYQHNKITKNVYNNIIKSFSNGRKYVCNKRT